MTVNATGTIYRLQYLASQLSRCGGGGLREEQVQGGQGVGWGMLTLMGNEEKPLFYSNQYQYIFFVVRGRANLKIGDGYKVEGSDVPLDEGFVAEVPRNNHCCIKNANAKLHATFLYYRICDAGPLSPREAPRVLREKV